MRLKSKVVVIMSLLMMLTGTLLGSLIYQNKSDKVDSNKPESNNINNTDNKIPDSFLGSFNDRFTVDDGVAQVIVRYMDAYFKSLYTLERVDTAGMFDNELSGLISDTAIDYVVNTRKLYKHDMSIKDAHYDLTVTRYSKDGDLYYVDLLEDEYMRFAFTDIQSSVYDIESSFVISYDGTSYKIHDLDKSQGYYSSFYENCDSIEEVQKRYRYLSGQMADMIFYNYDVLINKPESASTLSATKPYNRSAAVEYADKYYHQRNSEWFNYSETGGNCQNYASQSLLAGGIPMDFYGEQQWKCFADEGYDPDIDETETPNGRSKSWVNVGFFYDYVVNNYGTGLVSEISGNIFEAKEGDLIIVGNGELIHTVIVSKVVDGHVFVNSNSIDMKDYPIDAYNYTNVVLIKILGYNQYN